MKPITYKDAGVDIDEGDRFVRLIAPMAKRTFRKEVLTELGAFGALFELDLKRYTRPLIVSSTDGVGTKLKVAFMMNKHDTVGIDLVAMCVNDILTLGAEPLFFLDYFATGRLSPEKASEVIKGIAEGCLQAGCSLIGGETAEMPDFYRPDEYDLAGFAVGVVEKDRVVTGQSICDGDVVIGLASSGLHSNGYSLARKVFFERLGWTVDTYVPELSCSLGEALLKPTRIYVGLILDLIKAVNIKAMAHITGGGLAGNLSRVIPKGYTAMIKTGSWTVPPLFKIIQDSAHVPDEEMQRTFNLGIGYVLVCSREEVDKVTKMLSSKNEGYFLIGEIEKRDGGVCYV